MNPSSNPQTPQFDDSYFQSQGSSQNNGNAPNAPSFDESYFSKSAPAATQSTTPTETPSVPITTQIANQAKAFAIGGFHGEDRFITTILKLGAKAGLPGLTPEAVQATYDANTDTYNKSVQEHPVATILGDLGGTTAATAPMFALPGGVEGAGIGSFSGVGKLGLQGAYMAGQGATMGALSTAQGQDPNTILNIPGAIQGAKAGAVLGTTIQPAIASYLSRTGQLANAQQAAAESGGYTGKIFNSDLPANSWINTINQWTENNILQKLPGILGTSNARAYQGQQIQNSIAAYVTNLAPQVAEKGPQAVGNLLSRHANEIDNMEDNLWTKFTSMVPNKPVSTPLSDPITENINNILSSNKQIDTGLTTKSLNVLKNISNYNTPGELNTLKRQVWDVYSGLQSQINKGSDNPVIHDLADNTRQLYWALLGDMKNGLQKIEGDNSPALQAFNEANQFTQNSKALFDPKARPQLIAAIKDANDNAGKVSDFMRWLNSPTTSSNEIGQVQKVLGSIGQQTVAGAGLQDLYKKSMESSNGNPIFNISTFLDGISKLQGSPQAQLYKPALDSMSGLLTVAKQYAESINPETNPLLKEYGKFAVGGGVGAAIYHGGLVSGSTAGVLLTPPVLSFLASNSPLKNTLIQLSRLPAAGLGQTPASLLNYLSTKVLNALTRGGIQIIKDQQGNVILDKPKNIKPTALNEYTPLIPHQSIPSEPTSQLPQPTQAHPQNLPYLFNNTNNNQTA